LSSTQELRRDSGNWSRRRISISCRLPSARDKGLEARKETAWDGVPLIELVDGEKLVAMLEQLEMGLKQRRIYEIDPGFFDSFK
jgi:hypothetical protein